MTKILLYGVMSEDNFGGPSLMHGAERIIHELDPEAEIVCYQSTPPLNVATKDFEFSVHQIPYNKGKTLLFDAIMLKIGIKPKTKKHKQFFQDLVSSDIVVNLLGICFCENLRRGRYEGMKSALPFLSPLFAIRQFPLSFAAKLFGIKSVKIPASYGPIKDRFDEIGARFSAKYLFDLMYAREKESQRQMEEVARVRKKINVAPDLANFWIANHDIKSQGRAIGISVSHQIIRQWSSSENYIECMVNLIKHISINTQRQVILIPNEIPQANNYNDIHVAKEISEKLGEIVNVQIIDVSTINSSQLKRTIAECEVMIASRYHSCVAALSSGVPVLVIGWHHKYEELLDLYSQRQWMLSCEDCYSEKLIRMFDAFWEGREKEKLVIKEKYQDVKKALLEAGKEMFVA